MPTPANHVIIGLEDKEVVFAKDQPEYRPLPALVSTNGIICCRYELSDEERDRVAMGDDIFLFLWSGGDLPPSAMTVGSKDDKSIVAWLGF